MCDQARRVYQLPSNNESLVFGIRCEEDGVSYKKEGTTTFTTKKQDCLNVATWVVARKIVVWGLPALILNRGERFRT